MLRTLTRTAAPRARLPTTPRSTIRASSSPSDHSAFPCVDAHAARESKLLLSLHSSESGPEPPYARPSPSSYHIHKERSPLPLTYGPPLQEFDLAYETWGTLNPARDNAILLHTGLSASSHAASTPQNPAPGWWEKFIGPGKALDTNYFFIICANVIGGCYGSTGPSSLNPVTQRPYATDFPIVSIIDMVQAQYRLLDMLGIERLYASVGSSMGAMQSLAAGWLHPERVGKIVSISGTARSSPGSIAMRFAQRSVLMADPNWKNGHYYDGVPPHTGMKLARQIATITYRSGPEWDQRFGRRVRPQVALSTATSTQDPILPRSPALCPDFLIETYLDYQGEQFCLKYDANSLIYISKAMDLFDLTGSHLRSLGLLSEESTTPVSAGSPQLSISPTAQHSAPHLPDLAEGLSRLAPVPTLVLGVQSDILFPVEQQREIVDGLRMAGNDSVRYYELGGVWGHDTFLLDVQNVGGAIRGFLS